LLEVEEKIGVLQFSDGDDDSLRLLLLMQSLIIFTVKAKQV
jgi:hypothetical protein